MSRRYTTGILMLCLGANVQATVSAEVRISSSAGSVNPPIQTGAVSASSAAAVYGGTASASIDASKGAELGSVLAPTGGSATAQTRIDDVITFGAGASGVGSLVYRFHGDISSAVPGNASSFNGDGALLNLVLVGPATQFQFRYVQLTNQAFDNSIPNNCNTSTSPVCQVGTTFDYTGTLFFNIAPGNVALQQYINVFAFNGQASAFGLEQHFVLPTGVNYTSTLPVVTVVPETSKCALLVAGLAVVGSYRSRARLKFRWFASKALRAA